MLLILLFRHESEVDRLKPVCVQASEELDMLLETSARNRMKEIGVCASASRFTCVTGTPRSCRCRRSAVAILGSRSVLCRRRSLTRSQTRKIEPPKSGEKEKKAVSPKEPAAVVEGDATPLSLPPAVKEDGRLIGVDKGALQSAQKGCSTLQACFSQAGRGNSDFRVKEGTLFRESKDHYGNISLQVVIPQVYRDKILALCHEGTSSPLGVRKTKDRLLKHYFWPNCIKEIEGYVRSCDPCQRMGKGNEKVKVPLKLVPIITEVFSKMNIDAVGPLPTSSKGNSYLLTAICMSSRYPDAIPVADISSVSVTDALLEIFSKMGFPRQIQSDLGSSFTSFLIGSELK
ncbi:Retrovirus-related Pol polyprotein from transposon 412 [Araneus ventricosus]|uniref:RNA-directed DNA polymerase n=1 Tax=Araneus ventricosus TaxID=182803 RepID=A0A4Y2PXM5_ARAVE|nr:Retrovirus-related Pol polyprotein from transposon 412 [Araneus ventricosus]